MKKSFRMRDPPTIQKLIDQEDDKSNMSNVCLKAMVVVGVLIIAQYAVSQIIMRGYHQNIFPHHPGKCRNVIPMETGSEDIALTSDGLAFITSGIRLFHKLVQADSRILSHEGSIYLFDFNDPAKPAVKLKISSKHQQLKDFAPQGIAVWEEEGKGNISVFTVNHRIREGKETIEVFSFDRGALTLVHQRTIESELFRSLNDIAASGPDSFYVTNDGYYRYTPVRLLERFGMFPWGSVIHVDGKNAERVLDKTYEVSGIAVSPDRRFVLLDGGIRFVYIASPYSQAVHIYHRHWDERLIFHKKLDLGTAPDDVTFDLATGDLVLGCFPVWHQVFASVSNFETKGVAQVLRLSSKGDDPERPFMDTRMTELFADVGELISQSSTAVIYKDAMLTGSITDRMVYCDIRD